MGSIPVAVTPRHSQEGTGAERSSKGLLQGALNAEQRGEGSSPRPAGAAAPGAARCHCGAARDAPAGCAGGRAAGSAGPARTPKAGAE